MKNLLPSRIATNGLLLVISLTIIFHFLVASGVIPYEIVWGGRLAAPDLITFEFISIGINIFMLFVVAVHANLIRVTLNKRLIKTTFWIMFVLFTLNTIGNLFSVNELERLIFTPLTLLLAIFSLRLALENEKEKQLI